MTKTGKEAKPPGNLHRRQLFSWMGRSLDDRNKGRKVLRDDLVQELLGHLRGSLEHGIWVKTPRYPEHFELRGERFALDLPIACFTEWSLGESLPHTAEYGRVGFGFPKRWVIERGGQSVTYFRHSAKGSFLQSAFKLLATLAHPSPDGRWAPRDGVTGFQELRYLLHFAKMIRLKHPATNGEKRPATRRSRVAAAGAPAIKRPRTPAHADSQTFKRRFGQPLQFVEEREWRVVHHPNSPHFVPGPRGGPPDFFLPYIPGDELFTLVLPDNKVVSHVLERDWFAERLFTPWKHYPQLAGRRVPPVTLLSHSDIGTF